MDLRDGRRGDRLGVELREEGVERPAELGLDRAADLVETERRHLVAQPRELVDERAGQEVAARRRDLPDLDERRAEPRADVDQRRAERARHPVPDAGHMATACASRPKTQYASRRCTGQLDGAGDEPAAADAGRRGTRHGRPEFDEVSAAC